MSVGKLDVFYKNNDGLLGITLDPGFSQNGWVYLYYSPAGSTPKQHLSRFDFKDGKINMGSEKVLLEVPTQRDECCHSGGSLVFDKQGNLFISLGDNTSVTGTAYAPIDERPDRSAWDAQRTSGNTNDLRGKILRIHPEPDGTYTIPEGNLFLKGMAKTRPEIYIMGNRNPFRISVDNKTGFLYWGEIGPDAGKDSIVGPQSYDEFNQARRAGNYGWPYFVGDNKAYPDLDFATNRVGSTFNTQAPVNNSPNNTGLKQLPPTQLPMIWYPYTESQEFPVLGKGGRNAMAGQVYYLDEYTNSSRKFPDYYNGKWFIYEWMRNWIMIVTMDDAGKLVSIEPFAPSIQHTKPMDMQFSPDGDLYMLEYGAYWYSQNEDARLVRIEYNAGNRKPVVHLTADKKVGAAPLTVQFSSKGTFDRDEDKLTYYWQFTPDTIIGSTEKNPVFTFQTPGIYTPTLSVIDSKGDTASVQMEIKVGNEPPQIAFLTDANQSFYWDQGKINYQVKVTDREDSTIDTTKILIGFDYLAQGNDIDLIEQDYQAARASLNYQTGKNLIEGSDCKACHALDKKSVGPSYMQVAERYKGDAKALDFLSRKIISGGGGNWEHMVMSAHPQLTLAQTNEMVKYILSLAEDTQVKSNFPLKGTFTTREHMGKGEEGTYIISASYTDAGGNIVGPLTNREIIKLRFPRLQAEEYDTSGKVGKRGARDATRFVTDITSGAYISFNTIDLSQIAKLTFRVQAHALGGDIEIRLDSPQGKQIGRANIAASSEKSAWSVVEANIEKNQGWHDLYFVFTHAQVKDKKLFDLDWIYFHTDTQDKSIDVSSKAQVK
jgi:cytochrome c